jgi:ribosomal protein S18 acetylase RimI-like enzyme
MAMHDLLQIQECNLQCLPENYQLKYYIYHVASFPEHSFVAVDASCYKLAGYVLGKLDESHAYFTGHITSIAIYPQYRGAGIANLLMETSIDAFRRFNCRHVTLHVRKSNSVALRLYQGKFEFSLESEEKNYYADGESALCLLKKLGS